MVERPTDPSALQTIQGILDDYTSWFLQVVRHLFYPHAEGMQMPLDMPPSFVEWRDRARAGDERIDVGELERIVRLQEELYSQSERLMTEAMQASRQPRYDEINDLCSLYETFRLRLRRVSDDQLMAGLGYDAVTGLRRGDILLDDMSREMERMSRSNVSFSVVLIKLVEFESLEQSYGERLVRILKSLGNTIQETARVFDDAYRLGKDEFLVTLKSTDLYGAQRYSIRLRDVVKQSPPVIDGQPVPIALSFCISEPAIGEDLGTFINLMRSDLKKNLQEDGDAVVQYEDISPLQRFIRESK